MNILFATICLFVASFCNQSGFISPQQFMSEIAPGNTLYVVTQQKLGLPDAAWSIREDVVFTAEHRPELPGYLGSRGYEFRYCLHEHPLGYLQEFHTTIDAYIHSTPEYIGDTPIDLGYGVTGYIREDGGTENTISIHFSFANYKVNVKIKFSDYDTAVPLLIRSAEIILKELHDGQ